MTTTFTTEAQRARRTHRGLWGTLCILGALWAVDARSEESPVRVTARASKPEVTVGEPFEVEVEVSGPARATYTFPPEAAGESAELHSLARQSPPQGATPAPWPANQHRYEARVYAVGEATIPPVSVKYRLPEGTEGEAASEPFKVRVLSLLPKDAKEQKLADIRPPVEVATIPPLVAAVATAVSNPWNLAVAGLLLVSILLAVLWALRRRTVPAPLPRPELPPEAEALSALDRLARAGHFARDDGRGYYIELSLIAKRYLERRLSAPVVEMTSAEMLSYLRDSPHAPDLLASMRDLATAADQVKFARGQALREEGERHLAAVRALIARLEERLRPQPAADTDGKAA